MNIENKVKVLDCTLRDGGYYNNWDFEPTLVSKYLSAISAAKIDIIEIGFRFLPQNQFLGPFAYSTDDYLSTLPLPVNVKIAVMINASEIINYRDGVDEALKILFCHSSDSHVDIVRIAVHAKDVEHCHHIAFKLSSMGYAVFLNLMQIDMLEDNELSELLTKISEWEFLDVFYFADSLGSMDSNSIVKIVNIINSEWHTDIGIHAHDNKGHALSNCILALKSGVTHFDSTLLGMGRGAGNVKTENLLVEFSERNIGHYFPDSLFPLILQDFGMLQKKYNWGTNLYYFLSAVYGIHPSYIQEMLGDARYDFEKILSSINFLKSVEPTFFNIKNLEKFSAEVSGDIKGSWNAKNWAENRTILIIGSGDGTKRYINDLCRYIEKKNPIVLCLNINDLVPQKYVTAYVACHETRILMESESYKKLEKPIILPVSRIPAGIASAIHETQILDYGLCIEKGVFSIEENGCTLNSSIALGYALSISTIANCKRVLLAGMDGYEHADPRQKDTVDMFELYFNMNRTVEISAITPTTYPVEERSIYEPNL